MLDQEFYMPVEAPSVHFMNTKLCATCPRGFEVIDLSTLDTQALLDPSDPALQAIQNHDNLRALSIFRVNDDFLLCFDGTSLTH